MLDKTQLQWFEELTQLDGVSGHEHYVAQYLHQEYLKLGVDEIIRDNLGSLIALKKSKNKDAKKVMILGHMDEIGFLVKQIMPSGVLKIAPVGGWFSQTLLAHRIRLTLRSGEQIMGAIAATPPHMIPQEKRNSVMEIQDMVVDVGALSADDAKVMGISVGDMIVVQGGFESLNKGQRLLAKAFDNRYGCVMGLDIMHQLKNKDLDFDLYVGASVQEEVGLRGAQTITQLIQPDLAIVLDCSPANDALDDKAIGKLGEGVLIRMMDGNMIADKAVINKFIDVCKDHDIKHQTYFSPGGTDAGIVHKTGHGIKTLTCCSAARSIHTASSILDVNDYTAAKKALLGFLDSAVWGDLV